MTSCRLLEGREGDRYFIRVEGRGTWREARQFERLAMEARAEGGVSCLVNLESCSYLDSTFLGVITRLARVWRKAGRDLVVANPPAPLRQTMTTMGMAGLLASGEIAAAGPPLEAMAEHDAGGSGVAREESAFILEAHEELEALDERNVEKFRVLKDVLLKSGTD